MKHSSSGRRSRGRGGNNRRGKNRSQVFDSNGPDVRIRGTAHQVFEKYMALAKDAAGAGDRILAESYTQHAEHYQRTINNWEEVIENAKTSDFEESYGVDYGSNKRVTAETRTGSTKEKSRELEDA